MGWFLDTALKNAGAVFDAALGLGLARRRGPQPDHRAEPGIHEATADAVIKILRAPARAAA